MPATQDRHAELMDRVYRTQRHFYDVTRKYYLFGRDRMLRELDLAPGGAVLEIGCGTGRNLALVRRLWPAAALFGIDISSEMLRTARARLGPQARLEQADAAGFDADCVLGRDRFDRVIMPYCTSMIPQWEAAIAQACWLLAPGGSLHIVDFGDMAGLPSPARAGLRAWLARFHVAPRLDLAGAAARIAAARSLSLTIMTGMGGYYQMLRLTRAGHAAV